MCRAWFLLRQNLLTRQPLQTCPKRSQQSQTRLKNGSKRRISGRPHVFFAVCPPGLGRICEAEIKGISAQTASDPSNDYTITDIKQRPGGIEFTARLETACLINLLSGSATRILMRVAAFKADNFRRLEQLVLAIDWELYLPRDARPDVRVTTHKSRLYHSDAIAERLRAWVCDKLQTQEPATASGKSNPKDIPESNSALPQIIVARSENDRFELSLDMSGTPLYKRSIKTHIVKAPLRETLAFAVLTRLDLSPEDFLVDPMCGSGTFSLEGVMIQCGLPPGIFRAFAFEAWPGFKEKSFAYARSRLLGHAENRIDADNIPPIRARDLDQTAIDHLSDTTRFHKAFHRIQPECGDFFDMRPEQKENGVVVLNPPYGIRLDRDEDITGLYKEIGRKLATDFKGFRVGIICPNLEKLKALNLGLSPMPLFHGGLNLYAAMGVVGT